MAVFEIALAYVGWGVVSFWGWLGLSLHHLVEAFVTGLIIKAGYWIAHKLLPRRPSKQSTTMGALGAVGSMIDDN